MLIRESLENGRIDPVNQPVNQPEPVDRVDSGNDWFALTSVTEKIRLLPECLSQAFSLTEAKREFNLGRDVRVVPICELPPKPGLAKPEGQGRLLHDLASIELQAMELAVRTLHEFPDAPKEFRSELAEVALSEGRHLKLCLEGLDEVGFQWGHWDVHLGLWNMVAHEDSLIDRILIVHRYLEGSGLDAGDSILRRLIGTPSKTIRQTVKLIVDEEVDHVLFGSRWYKSLCESSGLSPEGIFLSRIGEIARRAPRRERLAREVRAKAGFSEAEMDELENCQIPLRTLRPV